MHSNDHGGAPRNGHAALTATERHQLSRFVTRTGLHKTSSLIGVAPGTVWRATVGGSLLPGTIVMIRSWLAGGPENHVA